MWLMVPEKRHEQPKVITAYPVSITHNDKYYIATFNLSPEKPEEEELTTTKTKRF